MKGYFAKKNTEAKKLKEYRVLDTANYKGEMNLVLKFLKMLNLLIQDPKLLVRVLQEQ